MLIWNIKMLFCEQRFAILELSIKNNKRNEIYTGDIIFTLPFA